MLCMGCVWLLLQGSELQHSGAEGSSHIASSRVGLGVAECIAGH